MRDLKLYMDVCCLNRPFDDQSQDRIHLEAEAILAILTHCQRGEWTLVASDMIEFELSRLTNRDKLEKVQGIYSIAQGKITTTQEVKQLASRYQQGGVKLVDSRHLALCEAHHVEVFLTTDDNLIRAAARLNLHTQVINPIKWLMEVTNHGW